MARQGLMDDAGYDFFDVSDCANYESCREDAYNDGYEKGRADKYQEIVSQYMLLTEKQVAEIRTDAIDEFANWLVEQGILGNKCIADGEITDYGKVYAKKYKEQNNDNNGID